MKASVSEWLKLAEAVFVLVPVSVEDERMFSSMKFLKNLQRNRLGQQHLTACARLFSNPLDLHAEGVMAEVIDTWNNSAAVRGRYSGKAQPV
jgi:hypothetical protein